MGEENRHSRLRFGGIGGRKSGERDSLTIFIPSHSIELGFNSRERGCETEISLQVIYWGRELRNHTCKTVREAGPGKELPGCCREHPAVSQQNYKFGVVLNQVSGPFPGAGSPWRGQGSPFSTEKENQLEMKELMSSAAEGNKQDLSTKTSLNSAVLHLSFHSR